MKMRNRLLKIASLLFVASVCSSCFSDMKESIASLSGSQESSSVSESSGESFESISEAIEEESLFLERDPATNLLFWITEKVTSSSFRGFENVPGLMGGREYLDPRYEMLGYIVPDVHVTYTVTSYPDYSDSDSYVTSINITDPDITVYGLNVNSSSQEIASKFTSLGFSNESVDGFVRWGKNNCIFWFWGKEIRISAKVSNRDGATF